MRGLTDVRGRRVLVHRQDDGTVVIMAYSLTSVFSADEIHLDARTARQVAELLTEATE